MFVIHLFLFFALVYNSSQAGITQQLQQFILKELTNATLGLNITLHEDVGLDINHFLRKYNYPLETHWVTTEDGYILRLHRIRKHSPGNGKAKPPILLMHGLSSSSIDWVNMGPKSALGLRLADAGYDVWLGNNRGNTWSRFHQTLDPDVDAKKFWDFSFEECGLYDLPAKIDYILNMTGHSQILYVGHSQGSSQFFAMAALRPEYNDKIALMTALAPVAYMGNISSPLIKVAVKFYDQLKLVIDVLGLHELIPHSWFIQELGKLMCSDGSPIQKYCVTLIFSLVGFDSPQLNTTFIPVITSNAPAGISAKMVIHFAQNIKKGTFNRYDYGLENYKHYNKSFSPPAINVSAITSPVVLYYAQNDLLSSVTDVERLATELPNVVRHVHINYTLFNHLDYIFATDINALLNDDLIEYIDTFIKNRPEPTTSTTEGTEATTKHNSGNSISLSSLVFVITFITRYFTE
ncbi:unnamed protein product [Phaedon cochleariae]|uniref:Partial AB-hydrolase lipase domain-containing protein n=1 Tax=Phaedon cochleariae TaxID=80249 RepID=A0A9P0DSG7_PHACE|nr:unnamed protein product [Phaedon cochleariae]